MTALPIRRVCFLTTTYPRWANDHRGTFIRAAALALLRQGWQVRVVTVHTPGARLRETLDSVEVWRIPYVWPFGFEICQLPEGGLPEFWRAARWLRVLVLPFFAALCVGALAGARGCQVIHAHWTLAALACRVTAWLHRKRYVTTVHGSDMYQAATGWLMKPLTRTALNGSRSILAVSRSLAEEVAALGLPSKRILTITNGVDGAYFFPADAPRDPVLLFCGSLIRRKGIDVLVDAMPAIRERHAGIRLVIIGDGPERARLKDHTEKLGLKGSIQFLGNLPQPDVGDWMRRATLFVLPSREEGQGVVALEAIACGTACVASRVGGIPDYLAEDMGRLVAPGDSAALAAAISGLLDQPYVLGSMRQRCTTFAQDHLDWDRIARQIATVYDQAGG